MNFDHIFNWKLLAGSHDFPGPEGGTCINEAAIVAAGFNYRAIGSANDCPPCFSRPIAEFALALNDDLLGSDAFTAEEKQAILKPFVLRLAGTADTPEVERQRYEFLIVGIAREVYPPLLKGWGNDLAAQAAAVKTLDDVRELAENIARASGLARASALARALARATSALALALARALALASALALALARASAQGSAAPARRALLLARVNLLDGVLKIGKQADPLDVALIQERMDTIKSRAICAA